jgi:Zn-dependent M16 (insulinase) family peptidase
VVHNGHRLAISLASRSFTPTNHLQEIWGGIHQLQRIKQVAKETAGENIEKLAADLRAIGRTLFCTPNLKLAVIGDTEVLKKAGAPINRWIDGLDTGGRDGFVPPPLTLPQGPVFEGWSTATAVSFVAQTFATVRLGHPDSPALSVIAKMLRSLYLHREIREKGGAYGGFALYNVEDGLFSFGSYRDPHIVNTLDVYRNAADFIRSGTITEEDVKEAVLQVCSEIDKPDPPGPAARKAFYRQIIGLSDDTRQRHKKTLLTTDRKTVMAVAERYFSDDPSGKAVAVISNRDQLDAANRKLAGTPLVLNGI